LMRLHCPPVCVYCGCMEWNAVKYAHDPQLWYYCRGCGHLHVVKP
jgi:hypothetical protein